MAKFRMVHTEFWNDPKVIEEMTPEDKYFFLYLLTNPNTTQIGIYQITKKQISFDTGYSMESVNSLLDRFSNHHKLIIYNPDSRELAIKNWGRYNLARGGKPMLDCVAAELGEVKDIGLIKYVRDHIENSSIKALYDTYHDTSDDTPTTSGQYKEEEKEEEQYKEKDIVPFGDIITYLNQKAGTSYRQSTKATQSHINARWKDGFRLDDFKQVIDTKVTDWKNDPKMSEYIRPETLFGTKFESYLNAGRRTSHAKHGTSSNGRDNEYDSLAL